MDLSKAFNTIYNRLMIVNLSVCGFSADSLKLNSLNSLNYLRNKGSIIGFLLFNIFVNDLFFLPKTCNVDGCYFEFIAKKHSANLISF